MELRLESASETWNVLVSHVEPFISSWEKEHKPPCLGDFLPIESGPVRRLALVELIKLDLEFRRKLNAEPKRLEHYLAEYPELIESGGPPCDLIYEEYLIRKAAGEAVRPEEYAQRFPSRAFELRKLMALASRSASTSLVASGRAIEQLEPGDRIDDFELLRWLGKGAFASVFLARQRSMQRLVALKISADRGSEPQMLAQLDHPAIVRVYDQRQLPDRKARLLYMQPVAGGTLQTLIKRGHDLPPAQRSGRLLLEMIDAELARNGQSPAMDPALRRQLDSASWPEITCRIGIQLAQALDYAHRQGVLHRDIKPANVLLAADGTAKLADFNISFSAQLDSATPAAYFGGSLPYMSPEQLEACNPAHPRTPDRLDQCSDLYSLGVVLWELLYGERPFGGEQVGSDWSATLSEMAARRQRGPPQEAADQAAEDFFEQLQGVLSQCLAAHPDDRYACGEELAHDLRLCLQPRLRHLLKPPRGGWRRLVQRAPVLTVGGVALVPNALAAVFNYAYNLRAIIETLLPHARPAFWSVQLAINGIAFPFGLALLAYLAWPVARRMLSREQAPDDGKLHRRALALGHYAAVISLVLWIIAGPAYALSLRALVGGLSTVVYWHFTASLALCGLIAAAYPFFFVTYLSVRVLYPALIRKSFAAGNDAPALRRLAQLAGPYLVMAGGVPLLGVTLLAFIRSQNLFAVGVLCIAGLFGFAIAFCMYRTLQRDLAALLIATSPAQPFGAETGDTFEPL